LKVVKRKDGDKEVKGGLRFSPLTNSYIIASTDLGVSSGIFL
jgi:hypothetical protein